LVATSLRCEIFPSDLDATAEFYVRVLGFAVDRDERTSEDPYLALALDGVRIGAAQRPEVNHATRQPPTGVELVIEVDDLDRWRDHVIDAGWPIADEITSQPWGLRDFRIIDPSGYYLRLTER
jgi:predicted enzyme related to lactoylglutathione lyase